MTRTVLSISLALWLMALMLPPGADAVTAITGMVRSQSGQPLPGLVLLEKGEIHNNRWDRGTLVDASGRFRIELAEGGQYGLHAYSSGYIYKPNAVKVESDKTLEVEVVLVPEPTRANDPVIKRVEFVTSETRKGKATIRMEVTDPNGDLGPQVLAFNAATGAVLWRFHANGPITGSATVVDGIVYFSTLERRTYGLDALTGKQVWTYPDGAFTPVVTDGHRIYVVGWGKVYAFSPRK